MKHSILSILGLAAILFAAGFAQAQNPDRVELKDGTIIRGTISEYFPKERLTIRSLEGKSYEFKVDDIANFDLDSKTQIPVKELGYFNNSTFGLMLGNNYGAQANPSFQIVNGIQFKERFQAGIGVGIETFGAEFFLPTFGEFKYHFRKKDFSPFVGVQGGYNWQLSNYNTYYWWEEVPEAPGRVNIGGPMAGLTMGLRNYTKRNFGYTFSMGYRFQSTTNRVLNSFWTGNNSIYQWGTETVRRHRIEARIGILFN